MPTLPITAYVAVVHNLLPPETMRTCKSFSDILAEICFCGRCQSVWGASSWHDTCTATNL